MSSEWLARVSSKTIEEFEALLAAWTDAYAQLYSGQVRVTPFHQPDRFYLFGSGSARGITLTPSASFFKGGRVEIRLPALSSRSDWRLCFFILEKLYREQRAAVSDESGSKLGVGEFTPSAACERGKKDLENGLLFLKHLFIEQGKEHLRLPNPNYDLEIQSAEYRGWMGSPEPARALEESLMRQAARLAFCRHATLVQLADGLTLNALGFEPAIYPASDSIALSKSASPPGPGQPGELCYLSFAAFLTILQEKIALVKEDPAGFYCSGLDLAVPQDQELYRRLLEHARDELPEKHKGD